MRNTESKSLFDVNNERHHGLDAVRGLCALAVAIYHFLSWVGVAELPSLGMYGVYVFFILSATVLSIVYARDFSTQIKVTDLNAYLVHRLARIFPLLAAVSVAYFGLEVMLLHGPLTEAIKMLFTMSGFFALQSPGYMSSAPGVWSLGVELLFYLIFPSLLLFLNNRPLWVSLTVSAIALVAQLLSNTVLLHQATVAQQWPLFTLFASFVFYFAVGFCIPRVTWHKSKRNLAIGLAFIAVPVLFSIFVPVSPERLLLWPLGALLPIGIAIGILFVYRGAVPSVLVRCFQFLGLISYSTYLLHPFVWGALKRTPLVHAPPLIIVPLCLVLTLLLSWLSYVFFEDPVRRWVRKVLR